METLLSTVTAFFMALIPGPATDTRLAADIEWSCTSLKWTAGPEVTNGEFHGTGEVDCEFTSVAGGGYKMLRDFMIEDASKQAKEIHAGPMPEEFAGMPSTYLDLTTEQVQSGLTIVMRADLHIATDEQTAYVYVVNSKDIQGEGNAQWLRKIDTRVDLKAGNGPNKYVAKSQMSLVVEKPGLVPAGMFKKQVVKSVEETLPEEEKTLIDKVANHL